MNTPWISNFLPVADRPMKLPTCLPMHVKISAARSPSTSRSSPWNCRSGNASNQATAKCNSDAGIQPAGKDDDFYKFLTFYDNRDEYNKISRIFEPSNRFYPETNAWNWQWDSPDSRSQYRGLRNASRTAYRRAVYLIGAALANRLLSAVHAYRAVKQYNRKLRHEKGNLEIGLSRVRLQKPLSFRLTVTKAF